MKRVKYIGLAVCCVIVITALFLWTSIDRVQVDMSSKIYFPQLDSVKSTTWQLLAQKKILFAHMSVGFNILEGVQAVVSEYPDINVSVSQVFESDKMVLAGLYHTQLGYNGQPLMKFKSFENLLKQRQSAGIDIVLMKLCYVDIEWNTNVDAVFNEYKKTINELESQMHQVTFLHCTVPLQAQPISNKRRMKDFIKSILGYPTVIENNLNRMKYNKMVRETWPAEKILDIATIEAVDQEGYLHYKAKKDQKIPYLFDQYTIDGGHLNSLGSVKVGRQLLILLAKNSEKKDIIKN